MLSFDVWQLVAGLGLFLFGMQLMENSVKQFAGRAFKLFLRKHTENRLKAIVNGALVTGLLQSSSVVSFVMLAFVGAGIVSMQSALGVVLGSNFGTTLNNWIVATVGFRLDIESFSYPLVGLSVLALMTFHNRKKITPYCYFILGFGLLFMGLGYIKQSVSDLVTGIDISRYAHYPLYAFLFIGFIVTVIIQASSATMAITLSALNAGAITFEMAIAVIIGSELGTTIKLVIGSAGGIAAKKRVAFGNFFFNAATVVMAFALLHPFVYLIKVTARVEDDLIGLVLFQSMINLSGILLFFPFLGPFTRFLEKRYKENDHNLASYISRVNPTVPEAAGEALRKETRNFIEKVMRFHMHVFHIKQVPGSSGDIVISSVYSDPAKEYAQLKQLEGEIMAFYFSVNEQEHTHDESLRLQRSVDAVRNAMYSAKSMKDIMADLHELSRSANEFKYRQYHVFAERLTVLYSHLLDALSTSAEDARQQRLSDCMKEVHDNYDNFLKDTYLQMKQKPVNDVELSTLLNVNREMYSSNKALLNAWMDIETTGGTGITMEVKK